MLSSNNARDVRAEPEDSRKALLATVEFPARHPEVLALAQKAVGDAGSPHEKVRRLVGFVDEFVADTYSVEPLSVLDIIQQKAGDCSVHSALFTAMARSVGIPTRTVSGLVCGELVPGEGLVFGAHAWNEVVLDGFWVPVDATWNETTTNATHIRFPVVKSEEFAALSKLQNARIEIIEAQAKP
jgi:transglutaminase-like putative cysteine protease